MALNPQLSINGLSSMISTYDAARSAAGETYMFAYVYFYGVRTSHGWFGPLDEQVDQQIVAFGGDPIPLGSQLQQVETHCGMSSLLWISNASEKNQLLLIMELEGLNDAHAQFFLENNLLSTEQIDGKDRVAILLDSYAAGNIYYKFKIQLASDNPEAGLKFHAMDCYVL